MSVNVHVKVIAGNKSTAKESGVAIIRQRAANTRGGECCGLCQDEPGLGCLHQHISSEQSLIRVKHILL